MFAAQTCRSEFASQPPGALGDCMYLGGRDRRLLHALWTNILAVQRETLFQNKSVERDTNINSGLDKHGYKCVHIHTLAHILSITVLCSMCILCFLIPLQFCLL